jgi:hypothetical protein
MKLAVMQPYIFPYIGYFQLINAVDKFVFYDDVNFIKKGWINRNRILVNSSDFLFAVPLQKISQNILIKDTQIKTSDYDVWKNKFLQTIEMNYKKAPHFVDVFKLITNILESDDLSSSGLAVNSVKKISHYLDVQTEFIISSQTYENINLGRQNRIIDICQQEESNHYINAVGGQELYKKEDFIQQGIKLNFLQTLPIEYKQFKNEFIPWLSIIDVLMFNSTEEVRIMINQYELI